MLGNGKALLVRVGEVLRIAAGIERERLAQTLAAEIPDVNIVFKGRYFIFGNIR